MAADAVERDGRKAEDLIEFVVIGMGRYGGQELGYGSDADVWATLGIVGPTRMDYPSTIASVRAVARYVGRFLAEG